MMGAGPGLQQVRHPAGAHQRQRGVAAALEAGRGVGGEAQPAGALAHRDRIEGGGFEQQPAAAGGRLGVLAADDPGDAEDLLVVGDHHDPLVEGDRRRLEEQPGALPLPGEADGDAAGDGVGVEDVGRLPQLQVGDVGGVHPGVHRLHLGREQRMQDLVGQGVGPGSRLDQSRRIEQAEIGLDPQPDRGFAGRERQHGRQQQRPLEPRRDLPGDPGVAAVIAPVGEELEDDRRVVPVILHPLDLEADVVHQLADLDRARREGRAVAPQVIQGDPHSSPPWIARSNRRSCS